MERYQITFWNSVPAFMEMLAAEETTLTQALTSLRTVVMGGDFLPVSLVKQLKAEKPTLRIHSVGGPTETTIWNISHEITADDLKLDVIPYGKPFPNTTYFIRNAAGQPAPMGVIARCAMLRGGQRRLSGDAGEDRTGVPSVEPPAGLPHPATLATSVLTAT